MRNPIQNLGDYNEVRKALQAAGGKKEILYKEIGDTAVAKASPKILIEGGLITACLIGVSCLAYKGYSLIKDRKQKIENEPALKQEFFRTLEE